MGKKKKQEIYAEHRDSLKLLANKLRALRVAKGMNKAQTGRLLNIVPDYYRQIEKGERNISFLQLVRMAVSFQVPLISLVDFKIPDEGNEQENLKWTIYWKLYEKLQTLNIKELKLVDHFLSIIPDKKRADGFNKAKGKS